MKKIALVFTALVMAFTCSAASGQDVPHHHGDEHIKKVMGKEGSEYNLMQVMHDLAAQMNRVQFGLYTNNRLMIEKGAHAIAFHPAPKGGIKPYLRKNAESIKEVIPDLDMKIHKTAREMAETASTATMADLTEKAKIIMTACVDCHDMFRD